ncbi:MAG: hypothetical protein AAF629_26425 [Chloroflexota bacterium]
MMQLFHAYIAGKHKLDRMDFFLVERRTNQDLRDILTYLGLNNLRQRIRGGELTRTEAEHLCIIASKLLRQTELEALWEYVERAMGIAPDQFHFNQIEPPIDKEILNRDGLELAIQDYHDDGLFLPLWANSYYDIPVKIGGFVVKEAQFILANQAEKLDSQFTRFVAQAETLDDLLGDP